MPAVTFADHEGFQKTVLRASAGGAAAGLAVYGLAFVGVPEALAVTPLVCSLAGQSHPIRFVAGSTVAGIYGAETAIQRAASRRSAESVLSLFDVRALVSWVFAAAASNCETAFAADGTEIDLMVRGKAMPARVSPMPFVPHRYKRGAAL